jgi:hypothetical protein
VLIEDWHSRLSKFDSAVINRDGRLERRFSYQGARCDPENRIARKDSEAPRASSGSHTARQFLNLFDYSASYRKGIASPTDKNRGCSIITQPVFSVSVAQATTLPRRSKLKSMIS